MSPQAPQGARGATGLRAAIRRRGDRLRDAAYLAVGALVTVTTTSEEWSRTSTPRAIATAVLCGVATLALLRRRRQPVGVVLLGGLSMLPAPSMALFPLALGALAVRRRDRLLAAVTLVGWALSVASSARNGDNPAGIAVSNGLTVALAVAVGSAVGARRDLLASLRERAEQAEATAALLSDQARLAERTRIAQEMHDVLAHRISLVALHAGGLEVRPDAGPEEVERSAALIRATARQALEDLRGVLGVLRADRSAGGVELAPQPRLEDVPRLVATSAAAGVPVTLVDRLPAGALLPEVTGRTVYRVVQEALTNVHKHARDARTTVTLAGGPGEGLVVDVVNVRPSIDAALLPGSGLGLVGLRERVELAGGRLEAGPTTPGGWRLEASFPWPASARAGR